MIMDKRISNLWTKCPEEEVPIHMRNWIDLYLKATKLGFPCKSGQGPSKEQLIEFINSKVN